MRSLAGTTSDVSAVNRGRFILGQLETRKGPKDNLEEQENDRYGNEYPKGRWVNVGVAIVKEETGTQFT